MSAVVTAASGSQWLWYVSRGSGLILLALFSVVVVLGIATRTGSAPRTWHRFTVADLHRTCRCLLWRCSRFTLSPPSPTRTWRSGGGRPSSVRVPLQGGSARPRHPRR